MFVNNTHLPLLTNTKLPTYLILLKSTVLLIPMLYFQFIYTYKLNVKRDENQSSNPKLKMYLYMEMYVKYKYNYLNKI